MSRDSIGIDVGGTSAKAVLLRDRKVAAERGFPTRAIASTKLLAEITTLVRAFRAERGAGNAALGVALPGYLDARRRRLVRATNHPGLEGLALVEKLARRGLGPVTLDTDTNAAAVAEARLGAGRDHRRVLLVSLGTGLGAAFIVDDQPVRLSHHVVGHVARIRLRESGPPCPEGCRGCAESLLGAAGIVWSARRALRATIDRERPELESPADLDRLARRDPRARAEWRARGEDLGALLAFLVPFLRAEIVVLGGGVAAAARRFLPATRATLRRRLPRSLRETPVVAGELGPQAGAFGAALLAN